MSELAIRIEDVVKEYRLGGFGGKTLREDLQSWWAHVRGKDDPNRKLDAAAPAKFGQRFRALDGVSLDVHKGEALGIIGHNGAGKSTLLKLLARVTAPTSGTISYNGRIASMLEVGTGFHPEMTGRENIYLNGAILGMSKAEIDKKFDSIVEYAELAKFIDTPVKRYSSGMYVKLAFSVAAHLDSEIMIMDEVLAVGDTKFQQKCLGTMGESAATEGRTILYVSHNLSTVQRLCKRCIVLNHGKVAFDGDTDQAIGYYLDNALSGQTVHDLTGIERNKMCTQQAFMTCAELLDTKGCIFKQNGKLKLRLNWEARSNVRNLVLRVNILHQTSMPVGYSSIGLGAVQAGSKHQTDLELDLAGLIPGGYYLSLDFHTISSPGAEPAWLDYPGMVFSIDITEGDIAAEDPECPDFTATIPWQHSAWGCLHMNMRRLS